MLAILADFNDKFLTADFESTDTKKTTMLKLLAMVFHSFNHLSMTRDTTNLGLRERQRISLADQC